MLKIGKKMSIIVSSLQSILKGVLKAIPDLRCCDTAAFLTRNELGVLECHFLENKNIDKRDVCFVNSLKMQTCKQRGKNQFKFGKQFI